MDKHISNACCGTTLTIFWKDGKDQEKIEIFCQDNGIQVNYFHKNSDKPKIAAYCQEYEIMNFKSYYEGDMHTWDDLCADLFSVLGKQLPDINQCTISIVDEEFQCRYTRKSKAESFVRGVSCDARFAIGYFRPLTGALMIKVTDVYKL